MFAIVMEILGYAFLYLLFNLVFSIVFLTTVKKISLKFYHKYYTSNEFDNEVNLMLGTLFGFFAWPISLMGILLCIVWEKLFYFISKRVDL